MVENAKVSRLLRNPTRRLRSMFGRFEQATSVLDELDRRLQALGIPMPPEDSEPAVDDEAQHRSSTS
jgi:hypothetical protein